MGAANKGKRKPQAELSKAPSRQLKKPKRIEPFEDEGKLRANDILGLNASVDKEDEELELEDLVFGADADGRLEKVFARTGNEYDELDDWNDDVVLNTTHSDNWRNAAEQIEGNDEEEFDFFIDTKANGTAPEADSIEDDDDDAEAAAEEDHVPPSITDLPPAWVDDDDVVVDIVTTKRLRKLRKDYDETTLSSKEYEERLRRQFLKMHPTPRWAKRATEETSTSTDDLLKLLRTSAPILDQKRKKRTLNPDRLDIMRVKDANQMAYSSSVVQTVRFHPTAPVLMTGGYDRTLRLFQVDGKRNPKIQSLYIKDLPIHRAHFTPDGTEILITGKRNYYYTFDIEKGVVERYSKLAGHDDVNFAESYISSDSNMFAFTGRDGLIHLVSRRTKQWITDLKMNGTVRRLDFSKDGKFLYSFGGDGEVYTWDLGERKCVHKFFDEGCVKATALAVTGGYNGLIATGSDTGVVNIYQTSSAMASSAPKPQKTILNLTTSISSLRFSPDSQILALASMDKKDAMRLLHVPSGKVFQNWPTQQTPLGYVSSIDFSRGGGYLATGNDKGKVLLYRLNAYGAL